MVGLCRQAAIWREGRPEEGAQSGHSRAARVVPLPPVWSGKGTCCMNDREFGAKPSFSTLLFSVCFAISAGQNI